MRVDGPFEPNCFASPTYEGHSRAPKCSYFLASLFRAIVHNATMGKTRGNGAESVLPTPIEDGEGHGNSSDGFYAGSINLEEFYRKSDEVRLSFLNTLKRRKSGVAGRIRAGHRFSDLEERSHEMGGNRRIGGRKS